MIDGNVTEDLRAAFDRDGYVLIPGVLQPDEVQRLRQNAESSLLRGVNKGGGTVLPNAAAESPEISWVIKHPSILEAVRTVIGSEVLMFTWEADVHCNLVARNWHKDTGELMMSNGYFDANPFGRNDCRVVKVGLYLQDHLDGTGLRVRPATQNSPSVDSGKELPLRTRAGDAVLFDVRITHRGVVASPSDVMMGGLSRLLPRARREKSLASWRHRWMTATKHGDRVAVYFAFGLPNEQTETFARRNMQRQWQQLGRTSYSLPSALADGFSTSSVSVADISGLLSEEE